MLERLAWDSEFFGTAIGRVVEAPTVETLTDLEAACADSSFSCLYLEIEPGDPQLLGLLARSGWRLVEGRVIMRQVVPPPKRSAPAGLAITALVLPDMGKLSAAIEALVPWSRFSVDERFGSAAALRMYQAWLRGAIEDPSSIALMAELGGEACGFVTAEADPEPRIGLLSATRPGVGVGHRLVDTVSSWAVECGTDLVTVTQARNAPALSFYEREGFRVESVKYVYHRWLH